MAILCDKENVQLYPFGFKVISAIFGVTWSKSRRVPVVRAASLHVSTTAMSNEISWKDTVDSMVVFKSGFWVKAGSPHYGSSISKVGRSPSHHRIEIGFTLINLTSM